MHRSRRRGSGRSLVISNFLNLLDIKIYQKYASYLPGKLRYPSDSPLSSPTPPQPRKNSGSVNILLSTLNLLTHLTNKSQD